MACFFFFFLLALLLIKIGSVGYHLRVPDHTSDFGSMSVCLNISDC